VSSLTIGLLIFACVFGGTLVGMLLRGMLPEHHLSAESKDTVKLGTGLIGTMAALVLGLLVASAKSSYDAKKDEMIHMSANALLLDRILAHCGPEGKDARELLRQMVATALDRIWGESKVQIATSAPTSPIAEELYLKVHQLPTTNDAQRLMAAQAQSIMSEMGRTRMLLFQQKASSISLPLLIVVTCWLSIMFVSFGLFAPRNGTVLFTLLLCALSVSGAIFLVVELDRPFDGLIQIPSAPFKNMLSLLGR
jgi:hypothetical protein